MKNLNIRSWIIAALVSISFSATADATKDKENLYEHGNKMHANHCLKCHTDDVYTRDNRFVKSLNALTRQVTRCKNNTGVPWYDKDTEAVVHFLNEKYYKF